MDLTILSQHTVRFRDAALSRRARGALSAAAISVIERRPTADWGGQLQEYLVSLEARDAADAARRVRATLASHDSYGGFATDPW